jgi:hypothetical protein
MATGRIGVTPTLGVRWSLAPTGGTTALSGLDDNSVSLVYSVGYEQVYRNGVLLSRGNDYTATDGTTVTLTEATITGDIIEIFAQQLVPLTDAISKGQFTAKGALLSASAASTPGVLGVGANDTVLTADSTEATGLKWAAVAASPASDSATVATSQSTTSTSYTDLATAGPAATVTTGTKALVIVNVSSSINSGGNTNFASFAVSGATTIAASDAYSFQITTTNTGDFYGGARATRLSTLTAGSNTFTMKYRVDGNQGTYKNREIIVIDLGS